MQGDPIRLSKWMLDVVQDAVDGNLNYKHSENAVERMARVRRLPFFRCVADSSQFLSNGLVNTQHFVTEHAFMTLILVVGVLLAMFFVIKKFANVEADDYKKVGRLD